MATVQHSFLRRKYSLDFIHKVQESLLSSLSDLFTPDTFSLPEFLLNLPTRHSLVDKEIHYRLHAVVAIILEVLQVARNAFIRPENPTSSSHSPSQLATFTLYRLGNRLT